MSLNSCKSCEKKAKDKKLNIVFGPIQSRRFGLSLGIDLSPNKKQCNFDCVYCELKGARAIERFDDIVDLETLINATKTALESHKNINVLTITANGEPTLYPHLEDFIKAIKPHLPQNTKSLILSNGSRFGEKSTQNALRHFDIVKFSLDSALQKTYKKIDRIHKNLSLDSIQEGIKSYAKIRSNLLICEVLLVKNINDNEESMKPLADFLREIGVDRVDLGTIDRPPAYKVEAVSLEQISSISKLFYNLCVSIPQRKQSNADSTQDLSESEILALLKRRPLEISEAKKTLSPRTIEILEELLESQVIIKSVGLVDFYTLK